MKQEMVGILECGHHIIYDYNNRFYVGDEVPCIPCPSTSVAIAKVHTRCSTRCHTCRFQLYNGQSYSMAESALRKHLEIHSRHWCVVRASKTVLLTTHNIGR